MDIDVEVDVEIDSYIGSLKRVSKSVQVLLNGIDAVMVLTLTIPNYRAAIGSKTGYRTLIPNLGCKALLIQHPPATL